MYITKWNRPIWKDYILYDDNCWLSGKGKTMEIIKMSVVARGGEETREVHRWSTEHF